MSKILANEIANFGDNAPIELKEGLNIPLGKPLQAAGVSGSPGQVLSSTGTSVFWITPFDGDYNSLSNRPSIPAAQVQSDWNASGGSIAAILNKPIIPPQPSVTSAAASGSGTLSYNQSNGEFTFTPPDLSNYDIAYGWGDHAQAGYLTEESDTLDDVCERGKTLASGQYICLTDVRIVGTDGIKASFFGCGALGGSSQGDLTMRHNDSTHASTISHGNVWGGLTISSVTSTTLTAGSPAVTVLTAQSDGVIINQGLTVNGNILLGTGDLTTTGKLLYSNNYTEIADLPSATDYHGMFAHVHNEGHGYFAHAGSWTQLLDTGSNLNELADVTTTAPNLNDVLTWDGSNWGPAAAQGGGGGGATSSDLQAVTDNGNSTTNSITVGGLQVNGSGLAETFKLNTNTVSDDYSGVSGTIGDIKRINEHPHYYDGTTWRPFYLSGTPITTVASDVQFNDVQLRTNFDGGLAYNWVNKRSLKITNVNPGVNSDVRVVTSPTKFGTHSMKCFTENGTPRGEGFFYKSLQNSAYNSWWSTPNATITTESEVWCNAKRGGAINWSQDWTLEFWIKLEDIDTNTNPRGIFHVYDENNPNNGSFGLALFYNQGVRYMQWLNYYGTSTYTLQLESAGSNNYVQGAWHFISLTYDASSGELIFHNDGVNKTNIFTTTPADYNIPSANTQGWNVHFGTFYSVGTVAATYRSLSYWDDLRITQYARYGTDDYTVPTQALPITVDAPPTVDPDWSNVILRSTFDGDSSDIGPLSQPIAAQSADSQILTTNTKYGSGVLRHDSLIAYLTYGTGDAALDISGTWTVEFWINFNPIPLGGGNINEVYKSIWSQTDGDTGENDDYAFGLRYTTNNYNYGGVGGNAYRFYWRNNIDVYNLHSDDIPDDLLVNQYNHVALVRNSSGQLTVFFNGYKMRANATDTAAFTDTSVTYQNTSTFRIGLAEDRITNEESFEGYIDDFRVTTTVKYTDNFTPPSGPLPTTGTIDPNPPGTATSGYLTYPTANGNDGQVLTSDGTGNVNWEDASYTETDPIFSAHVASDILQTNINNWNSAYGWGDHATAGYLTAEADTFASVTARGNTTSQGLVLTGGNLNSNAGHIYFNDSSNEQHIGWTQREGVIRQYNNRLRIMGGNPYEEMAVFNVDGSVELYYNGVNKFETTISGANISGSLTISDDGTDVGKLVISDNGASSQLSFYNTSGVIGSSIQGVSNNLYINGSSFVGVNTYSVFYGTGDVILNNGQQGTTSIFGQLTLGVPGSGAMTFPTADGSAGDVLSTDGAGNLSWTAGGGGGANVTISDTAPGSAQAGDLWWESDKGRLKIYYNDTDSDQWVDASPPLAQPNVPVAAGNINMNANSPAWTGTTGYTVAKSGGDGSALGGDVFYTLTFPTAYAARTDYIVQASYDGTDWVAANGAQIGIERNAGNVVFCVRRWNEDPLNLGDIMVTITNL